MGPYAEIFRSSMSHWFLLGFLKKHSVNRKSNVGDNPEKEEADDFRIPTITENTSVMRIRTMITPMMISI